MFARIKISECEHAAASLERGVAPDEAERVDLLRVGGVLLFRERLACGGAGGAAVEADGLMVVTRLRDEAHRFAITYHRSLRERTIRESVLDGIPGIGPAKKMALLRRFHSVRGVARAEEEEIAAAAGISAALAAAVRKVARSAAGEKA